jgi:hypothetical protein
MNLDELRNKLIAIARANPPGGAVPYAFEKRIMAHLRAFAPLNQGALWGRALWRAAAPCVAIMMLLGAWSLWSPPTSSIASGDLGQEFDNTVLAAADQDTTADLPQ